MQTGHSDRPMILESEAGSKRVGSGGKPQDMIISRLSSLKPVEMRLLKLYTNYANVSGQLKHGQKIGKDRYMSPYPSKEMPESCSNGRIISLISQAR